MSDEDYGEQEFDEVKPLDAQERKLMDEITAHLKACSAKFDKWLKSVEGRIPRRRISFKVTLEGESLRKLEFLRHLVVGGYKAMSDSDLTETVVRLGIDSVYDSFTESSMRHAMKMLQLEMLPPEIREAVMTEEVRESIRGIIKQWADQGDLQSDMAFKLPTHKSPKVAGVPSAPKGEPSVTVFPENTKPVCVRCGKAIADEAHLYEGKKFHTDCLIDYGVEQKNKESL